MDQAELHRKEAEILKLIEQKFGIRKGDLPKRMRRIGRRVPPSVHQASKQIAEARTLAAHPQLALRIDDLAVKRAADQMVSHLKTVDMADKRKGLLLSLLGSLAINVLAVVSLLIVVAVWRGWV